MQVIWHILLTVCLHSECKTQDVQWFDSKEECELTRILYEEIPPDGHWTSVTYVCKPKGSIGT